MSCIARQSASSKYSDRGSSFFGFLYPVESVSNFKIKLKETRNSYLGATHVCSAYRIINSSFFEEKGSDDGEPRGSAGLPILNELKRVDIVNVCVFIVRYYGGTKLGVPGLIHAYSETTRILLSDCKLLKWEPKKRYIINHSYKDIDSLDFIIKKYNSNLLNRDFNLFVQSVVEISDASISDFKKMIDVKLPTIDSFIELK
tara:strand:+ start:30 stop:632 length:603 start_codon:yes stop_codon:yes gene_type:complete